jgi:outer membrane lipoprotein-sorting protein
VHGLAFSADPAGPGKVRNGTCGICVGNGMVKKERALGWVFRVARPAAAFVALSAVLGAPAASRAGSADAALQNKIRSVYASVKSYRLTVLGSVRSTGDFVAPNKYEMTTDLDGKPVKTIIIGTTYWIYDQGKWEKSGDTGSSLDADIAGVIRRLKLGTASNFVRLPDQMRNGKRVGAFRVSFGGSNEVCDFDLQTYYVTRCQRDELTILYSGFNDPSNTIPVVR